MGCSPANSGNAKAPFLGKWYDDAGDIRLSISDDSLTISGSGKEELHSGFDTGGNFSKTMDYEVAKNTNGNDAVEISVGGQLCTLMPVQDFLDFHCYAGTRIFLKKQVFNKAALASEETLWLPPIGTTEHEVQRRFTNVPVYEPQTDGIHIYIMHTSDGSEATVHLEYAKTRRGQLIVKTVKINTGRTGSPLSPAWLRAFHTTYLFNRARIPLSTLSASDRNDGTPQGDEEISFHRMPSLASLNEGWYANKFTTPISWKRGTCPNEPPTLIMEYSSKPGADIEIYSEFLGSCYPYE